MADGVFNIAKGKVNEYMARVDSNDPTNSAIVIVLLKLAEADGTLEDYDDLDTLLTQAGSTEMPAIRNMNRFNGFDTTGQVIP